jgi:hypothetical protein
MLVHITVKILDNEEKYPAVSEELEENVGSLVDFRICTNLILNSMGTLPLTLSIIVAIATIAAIPHLLRRLLHL